jgi:sugar phosphate permease
VVFLPNALFSKSLRIKDRKASKNVNIQRSISHEDFTNKLLETSVIEEISDIKDENQLKGNSFISTIKLLPILYRNKVFVCSVLSLSSLCYVITVIQFWGSDYMENVLKVEKATVNIAFIIVCLTAPTLGVILGGIITGCTGGYEKIGASYICLIGALSATLLSIPIPFMDTLIGFTGFLYGVLVFGGMIFPSVLGKYLISNIKLK